MTLPPDITQRLFPEDNAIKYFTGFLIGHKPNEMNIGVTNSQTIKQVMLSKNPNSVIGIIDFDKKKPAKFEEFTIEIASHNHYKVVQHKDSKTPRYLICIKPPYEGFIYKHLSPDKNFHDRFCKDFPEFKYFENISKRIYKSSQEFKKYSNCINELIQAKPYKYEDEIRKYIVRLLA